VTHVTIDWSIGANISFDSSHKNLDKSWVQ
jgi:hypothetical protein